MTRLTPEVMVNAYAQGYFPMAEPDEGDAIYWYKPHTRALLPVEELRIPRRLARTIRQGRFQVTRDCHFEEVISGCADHDETWLSPEIMRVFGEMHEMGLAHCVGVHHEGVLVGGIYGLWLNDAFFAESMFHRQRDASKVALVSLVDWLQAEHCRLLDVQFMTDHLRQFGAFEVEGAQYEQLLAAALGIG